MKEVRADYIKFLIHRAHIDLSKYNVSGSESEMINRLLERILNSDNLLKDLYILSNIPELRNIGKYLVYILKKLEDGVISFDNIAGNIKSDKEYIENEILNLLSNPKLRKTVEIEEDIDNEDITENIPVPIEAEPPEAANTENVIEDQVETEEEDFKKNYLELIYSETKEDDFVYEIPRIENSPGTSEILPDEDTERDEPEEAAFTMPAEDHVDVTDESYTAVKNEDADVVSLEKTDEYEEVKQTPETESGEEDVLQNNEDEESAIEIYDNSDRITLSKEIQEEIDTYVEEEIEDEPEEPILQEPPTNALFTEYEEQVIMKNEELAQGFASMIKISESRQGGNERSDIIKKIIEISTGLEEHSQKMSLEIISNIYNTITLSFEKIAEGKYDLSESTLRLFSRGLSLVSSLIKGDDYFGYKDILKSIENIRSALLEDKRKRDEYLKRKQELKKAGLEFRESFADAGQKEKFLCLRDLIRDTEFKLKQIDKITGEYQIYEALRSISIPLNNFKEIVTIARELNLSKMIKLSEGSYVFIKFLQNYRINPVSTEAKEIFSYIIFNLKSLALGKQTEDIDVFISYLNDPVKIFSNSNKDK